MDCNTLIKFLIIECNHLRSCDIPLGEIHSPKTNQQQLNLFKPNSR